MAITRYGDVNAREGLAVRGPIYVEKSDGTLVTVADTSGNIDAPVTTSNLSTTGTTTLGDGGDATQINGTLTVGEDDTGYDVKFFGATASKFMVWDESQDGLIFADNTTVLFGGDESTADGVAVYFDGTDTLAIDAINANDKVSFGSNTATDVVFTSANGTITFDASEDSLTFSGVQPVFSSGYTASAESVTPNNDSGAASTITAGITAVDVQAVTNDANDWVVLPPLADVPVGHTIYIACNAGGNFELRTPASSTEKINNVNSDGTQEYLCTDTDTVKIWKLSASDGWVAQSITNLGAVRTAVVPD